MIRVPFRARQGATAAAAAVRANIDRVRKPKNRQGSDPCVLVLGARLRPGERRREGERRDPGPGPPQDVAGGGGFGGGGSGGEGQRHADTFRRVGATLGFRLHGGEFK